MISQPLSQVAAKVGWLFYFQLAPFVVLWPLKSSFFHAAILIRWLYQEQKNEQQAPGVVFQAADCEDSL